MFRSKLDVQTRFVILAMVVMTTVALTVVLASGRPAPAAAQTNALSVLDTIDELRGTLPKKLSNVVIVQGYSAPGDGGGGMFTWDPGATEADDGGLVIDPIGIAQGRWKRSYTGPILLNWFGVHPGGVITSDLAPLLTRFADGQRGHFKLMPGHYRVDEPLKLPNPSHQVWDFQGVELIFDATVSGVLFEIGDSEGLQNYVFDTTVHAPEINRSHSGELDVPPRGDPEATIGLRTTNLYHSTVHDIAANYVTIGFQPFATGVTAATRKGNVYNTYHLRQFKNNIVSIRPAIEAEGSGGLGWVNENLFIGGRFWNNWDTTEYRADLLEAHVILPAGFSCNQNTFLKPSFEGRGQNAVRLIGSGNVILHPRPEFTATGGSRARLDGEFDSMTTFPAAVVTINPASTGNQVEMLYFSGKVEPYASGEGVPSNVGTWPTGNRWRTREGEFMAFSAPQDVDFTPQRTLERTAAITLRTPADLIRDLYKDSGFPHGRRYESERFAVSESVAIGGVDRYQMHNTTTNTGGTRTLIMLGGTAHMHSDQSSTPPPLRWLADTAAPPPPARGDTFVGADASRWYHDGTTWRRYDAKRLAGAIAITETALPHGLPYTPTEVTVTPYGNAVVWRTRAPDATNVYLQASTAVSADVLVR